ncbi:hypothetical protein HDU97_010071 [Phlyctochytrium planicorne]|nr:hypothetical protein HDU97_010071 [Phlyctochytrium planicorne]
MRASELRANTAPQFLKPQSPSPGGRSNSIRFSSVYRAFSTKNEEVFRSVTAEDVNLAFSRMSSDGKKVSKEDVKQALDKFFPNLSGDMIKLFGAGKAEMTKEALVGLLLNRTSSQDHFEDTYEMFGPPENGHLPDSSLMQMIRELNKYGMPQKGDIAAIKARFDKDKDGEINLEDFKRMNMRS